MFQVTFSWSNGENEALLVQWRGCPNQMIHQLLAVGCMVALKWLGHMCGRPTALTSVKALDAIQATLIAKIVL